MKMLLNTLTLVWDTVMILGVLIFGLGIAAPYLVSSSNTVLVFLGVLAVPVTLSVALGLFVLLFVNSFKSVFLKSGEVK